MDAKAIAAARVEFDRASQSVDDLLASNHLALIETHWAAFLVSSGRVFTKLEQGSKCSAKSKAWWGRKLHERRTDPLLCYLWHARNADEHGIQAVTQMHPGSITAVDPTDEESDDFHRKMKAQPHPYVGLAVFEIVNPHVRLVEVTDRGNTYPPPQMHGGEQISSPHPNNVGLLALAYLSKLLEEAATILD